MAVSFTNRVIPIHIKEFRVQISPVIRKSGLLVTGRRDNIRSTTFGGLSEEEMRRFKEPFEKNK